MYETDTIEVKYNAVDRLYYIERNGVEIDAIKDKPTSEHIEAAVKSDQWSEVFERIRKGETVRVSMRIYYDMLGCVPPIRHTENSFYCGEPYSGRWHHYFFKKEINGHLIRYGRLQQI